MQQAIAEAGFDIANATPVSPVTPPASAANLFLSTDGTNVNYLRLAAGVSAVNGGSNDYIDGDGDAFVEADATGLTDLAGDPRLNNTTVDVGAYEFRGSSITLTSMPADLSSLSSEGGNISVDITLGGFADDYTVDVSTATFTSASVRSGVRTLTYAPNTTTSSRTDRVTFTTTSTSGGEGPSSRTLTLTQVGRQGLTLATDPMDVSMLGSGASTFDLTITLEGSAEGWSITVPDFITEPDNTTGTGTTTLTLSVPANTGASNTGVVSVSTTGGTGDAATRTVTVAQAGAPPTVALVTDPVDASMLPSATSTVSLTITPGGSAVGWEITGSPDYVSPNISSGTGMRDGKPYHFSQYRLRTHRQPCSCDDGRRVACWQRNRITIGQVGGAPVVNLSAGSVDLTMLSEAGGTVDIDIDISGGATEWRITEWAADLAAAPSPLTGNADADHKAHLQ